MRSKAIEKVRSIAVRHKRDNLDTGTMLLEDEKEDSSAINEVIASLDEPDKYIIRGAKFSNTEFLKRLNEITIPVKQPNGEIVEKPIINYKIQEGKLVERTPMELEYYLKQTSQDQIIKDLALISKLVTEDKELVEYFKEESKKKPPKARKGPPPPVIDLTKSNESETLDLEGVDQMIDQCLNKIQDFSFIPNMSEEEAKSKLKIFVKNYIVKVFGEEKQNQATFKDEKGITGSHMYMVLGSAAAGKSTTITNIHNKTGAMHLVSDDIKASIAVSFGADVNNTKLNGVAGQLLKAILIPCSIRNNLDVILEKVGDEHDKIETLAKSYKEAGYEIGMTCIHVDITECRLRNIARAIGFMRDGKPPRMVPDSVVKGMASNPLMTYIMLMEASGNQSENERLFSGGECFINQQGKDVGPVSMAALTYGDMRDEKTVKEYTNKAKKIMDILAKSIYKNVINNNPKLDPQTKAELLEYSNNLVERKDALFGENSNSMKYMSLIRCLFRDACKEVFSPRGDVLQSISKTDDMDQFKDFIEGIAAEFCKPNSENYKIALEVAEKFYKRNSETITV